MRRRATTSIAVLTSILIVVLLLAALVPDVKAFSGWIDTCGDDAATLNEVKALMQQQTTAYKMERFNLMLTEYPLSGYFNADKESACSLHCPKKGCNDRCDTCISGFTDSETGEYINLDGIQCIGYARYAMYRLYGTKSPGDGFSLSSYTGAELKSELQEKGDLTGAHFRATNIGHSLVYLARDNEYIYFIDCNTGFAKGTCPDCGLSLSDCKIWLRRFTYAKFAEKYSSIEVEYVSSVPVSGNVTVLNYSDYGTNTITDNNAILHGQVNKSKGSTVTRLGIRVRRAGDTYENGFALYGAPSQSYADTTQVHMWYDINTELGVQLIHNTGYYYQFYCQVNNQEYWSEEAYFSTTGTHTFTPWEITKQPSCVEAGKEQRTCTICLQSEIITIPANGEHVFDNACDTTCNVCSHIRTTSHSYTAATCTAPKTCTVCGITSGSALGHSYTNACDTSCNRCGATRSTTHKYEDATCMQPETCMNCGITSGFALGHSYTNACDASCDRCGANRSITHSYKMTTTKATLSKNGSIVEQCAVCGNVESTTTIARPTTFALSTVNYTYNGAVKKPAVTVKDANGKTLKNGTDYTVSYPSGRVNPGSYTITVTMKGRYSGTKKLTFNIKLVTPTVKATNATNGVKITWNAIAGAKNYKVYKSVYTNGAWSSWTAIKTGVTGTSYTDTTVKSADNVKYTVRAFNGSNSSSYKASNSIKFLATPTVKATNAAKGVTVTWNKITGAKSYIVYKSVYSGGKWGGWTRVATGVTGTSYTDTTVKSGANVRYTVKAINGNFTSYIKASNSIKFLATPTVKVAKTTTGIKVSWNAVGSAKGYIVYRRTYTNGKWSGWTAIKTTTAVSFTDTTANKGVTYQYTVRAYNGNFKSWFVNSASIKR